MDNYQKTFENLIRELKIPLTKTTSSDYLEHHPDYGSLLAYSDTLDKFNVENVAIRVLPNQIEEMPTPFVTFFRERGGIFTLVKKVNSEMVSWLDTDEGWKLSRINDFTKNWSGVVLLAEANDNSGEREYTKIKKKELLEKIRLPLIIFLGLTFIIAAIKIFNFKFETTSALLLLSSLLGLTFSILLFLKNNLRSNNILDKICNVGSKVSCQSLLDSPASKLTTWLNWSDVGLTYFLATSIALILFQNQFVAYSFVLSSLGLIFCAYSISYQALKAKIWCPLCLAVVSTIIIQFIISVVYIYTQGFLITFEYSIFYTAVFCLTIPILFIVIYKPVLQNSEKGKVFKKKLVRFSSNPLVKQALLESQKPMPFVPQGLGVITIGNKTAENTITVVSNLLCSYCADKHKEIEKIIHDNKQVNCQIILRSNDFDDGTILARKILSLPNNIQEYAINTWFEQNDRNVGEWVKKFEDYPEKEVSEVFRIDQNNWSDDAEIKRTPTVFVNGFEFPYLFELEDFFQPNTSFRGSFSKPNQH